VIASPVAVIDQAQYDLKNVPGIQILLDHMHLENYLFFL
jgi:hypothetical protein